MGPWSSTGVGRRSSPAPWGSSSRLSARLGRNPPTVEGVSLAPVLNGKTAQVRDSMFSAYRNFQRAVKTNRWKLILYNVNRKKTAQLFDLLNDPWEMNNMAGDPSQTGRVRELTTLMKSWMNKTDDPVDLDRPDWGVKPEAGQAACDCAAPGYEEC